MAENGKKGREKSGRIRQNTLKWKEKRKRRRELGRDKLWPLVNILDKPLF